ncbi:MAG TPA: hypothetical protein VKV40_12320 [Ktedonobacteraceae bacterium]|nr:hypothetical protein [Ktedonobacteraceae bacterium]
MLGTPASLPRFVNDQVHAGSCWHKGRDDEQEQLATHSQGRPAGPVEYLMKEAPIACLIVTTGTQSCGAAGPGASRLATSSVFSTWG